MLSSWTEPWVRASVRARLEDDCVRAASPRSQECCAVQSVAMSSKGPEYEYRSHDDRGPGKVVPIPKAAQGASGIGPPRVFGSPCKMDEASARSMILGLLRGASELTSIVSMNVVALAGLLRIPNTFKLASPSSFPLMAHLFIDSTRAAAVVLIRGRSS